MPIEITAKVTALDGKKAFFSLSVDDAWKLYAELHDLFSKRETEKSVTVPYYGQPATPFPYPDGRCEHTKLWAGDPMSGKNDKITIGDTLTAATTSPGNISTATHPGAFGSSWSHT